MTKIVTRLIVIGILTTLCIGVMIGSVILINQRSIQDGYLINIAGKERMLTQKITKEVFIINSQNQQNFDELNLAIKEFEENLHTLRYGNQKKNINPPSNSTIIKQLALIEKQWLEFKKVVQDFKEVSYKFCKNKLFLDENNSIILKLSDNIVQAMVNAKMSPSVIDTAGKQRMLTQRMAHLFMSYANKWDSISHKELLEVYHLYDRVIFEFYNNPTYQNLPKVHQAIKETYDFWQGYKEKFQDTLKAQEKIVEDLKSIVVQNMNLLNQIDWTVNYYSDVSTHSRAYLEKFQYVAAVIMVLLALYSIKNLFNIHAHLKQFLEKTQMLAQGQIKEDIAEAIELEGGSELSLASKNLSKFLNKFHMAQETSNRAKELSEDISEEIASISEEIKKKLEVVEISESKRRSIENAINLGEDMAIQSSEQLIVVARLLEKLHRILKEIQECCKDKNPSK